MSVFINLNGLKESCLWGNKTRNQVDFLITIAIPTDFGAVI